MEKHRSYVALTGSVSNPGRFIGIVNYRWHWSISRSSAVRLYRLMKMATVRKFERYTGNINDRWLYWWF